MEKEKNVVNSIVPLLVEGWASDKIRQFCAKLGLGPEEADAAVLEARRKIAAASDVNRDEQVGKAVMRLEGLYTKAARAGDTRTALQIQRELDKLLGLHINIGAGESSGDDVSGSLEELRLVRAYLLPLRLIDPSYPVSEHARVAAELLRENGLIPNVSKT